MKTFKELQDEVLQWMADENDTGLMRDLVKQSLDKSQRKLLGSEQLDFMLSPLKTLTVVSGQKLYALPDDFLSLLFVKRTATGEFLEEVPAKSVMEADDGLADTSGELTRFLITAVQGVKAQPTAAGVVVVTASGGTEAAANGIVVQGLDANGAWVEETLSDASPWTTLTSSTSFLTISNIIKTGTTWTRSIAVTVGATTILSLGATEFAKQYQLLELFNTPTANDTLYYRYFAKPIELVYDNQLPQIPETFRDFLVYETLLMMPGFTRATPEELQAWVTLREELHAQLKQHYQQSRSIGARARRVRMIERV